jgi:hypothetical protein
MASVRVSNTPNFFFALLQPFGFVRELPVNRGINDGQRMEVAI